jgi:formylglycine-generating enzyme required for sulfatase activity
MQFVRIDPGTFQMGESAAPLPDELVAPLSYPTLEELQDRFPLGDPKRFAITQSHVRNGDFDEKPMHSVRISRPFFIGVYEVTNVQYEQFDPYHRQLRGKMGFSSEDDEAVVFVSWTEARKFCEWLSEKEGLPYRLPTEAEWEYAARAGTKEPYFTGLGLPEEFHKNQRRTSFTEPEIDVVSLVVGQTPPNPWGLFDVHGNVEEWVLDWYGPYQEGEQKDPVGHETGDFRVTRGGSHGTNLYYLRSANRSGTLPENKHMMIGFRVILADEPLGKSLPRVSLPRHQKNVVQEKPNFLMEDKEEPFFKGPRSYIKIPRGSLGPIFSHHNHDPAITECPNGDLLAIWYTCVEERGRELSVAASRLRHGQEEWEEASVFWDAPDRNDHCPALWFDGDETIYHFNGLSTAGKWEPLAIVMRTSRDSGATWSPGRLIVPEHGYRQMVGEPVFRTSSGAIVFGADAGPGSALWVSQDEGLTWKDPKGTINGIHAGIAPLKNNRILALGRNQNIDGMMPQSISSDMGRTWKVEASSFPPISGGQRAVLFRLRQRGLLFASFTDNLWDPKPGEKSRRHHANLFASVSHDEGKTWPIRRILSDQQSDSTGTTLDSAPIRIGPESSEPLGYLSGTQSADGVIHILSSANHYAFNMAWLSSTPPMRIGRQNGVLESRRELSVVYNASTVPTQAKPPWHFLGETLESQSRAVRLVSRGLSIRPESDSFPRWSNERLDGFYAADPTLGFTAEIQTQVWGGKGRTGIDFEIYARGGTLTANHYRISVTGNGVYYWYDGRLIPLATGLDNASGIHTYRLAVRPDTAVQIYRDDRLLSTQPQDLQTSWRQPTRGSYIEWGVAHRHSRALVSKIAYDLSGPYQP